MSTPQRIRWFLEKEFEWLAEGPHVLEHAPEDGPLMRVTPVSNWADIRAEVSGLDSRGRVWFSGADSHEVHLRIDEGDVWSWDKAFTLLEEPGFFGIANPEIVSFRMVLTSTDDPVQERTVDLYICKKCCPNYEQLAGIIPAHLLHLRLSINERGLESFDYRWPYI